MTRPPSPPSSSSSPLNANEPTRSINSNSNGDSSHDKDSQTARYTSDMLRHAQLPQHHTQKNGRGGPFASPRLCSAPLFAVPSVSLSNAHAVSSSVGPLTPPLTLDQQQAVHNTTIISNIKISSPPPLLSGLTSDGTAKLRMSVTEQQKQHHNPIQQRRRSFGSADVVHDIYCCMFRITLDTKGSIAALCYLPTRFQRMIEFYHTEIPAAYRDLGLGDLLVAQAFRWAEATKLLVIPTCPFVQRYLDRNNANWDCVVHTESEGLVRLFAAASLSSSSPSPSSVSRPHHQSPPSPAPVSLQHEEPGTVE